MGLFLSILLIGCSANDQKDEGTNDKPADDSTEQVKPEKQDDADKPDEEAEQSDASGTTELSVEKETADEISKDENVEDAIIQLETVGENKYVNAHIKFKEFVKGEETAKGYADQLKEKYPERTVDIILSRDGDVLYQDTFK